MRLLAIAALSGLIAASGPALAAAPLDVFKATQPGGQTLDAADEGGGNPFATALIGALSAPDLSSGTLPGRIAELTDRLSAGFQRADVPARLQAASVALTGSAAPARVALVVVYSAYPGGAFVPLPGAAHDAERVTRALQTAGFRTTLLLNPRTAEVGPALDQFGRESAAADVALVYATGHGFRRLGQDYVLPADRAPAMLSAAVIAASTPVEQLGATLRARRLNLLFFGGCREFLFGQ
jgi:hypothetical protein